MAEHVSVIRAVGMLVCAVLAVPGVTAEGVGDAARKVPPVAVARQATVPSGIPVPAAAPRPPALPYDPLRPPASLQTLHEEGEAKPEQALQLESVQTTGARRVAVISGQRVVPGQRVRDYRVISVDNRHAVLEGPQGRLVLWLVPALHGQTQSPAAKTDTMKQESAGVGEKIAPSIGERK